MKRTFTQIQKYATMMAAAVCTLPAMAESGLVGTWFVCSNDYTKSAESAWENEYPARFDITIEPAQEGESNWDLRITNLCNQGKTYGGTLSDDGRTLTIGMPGYCYLSDRDYQGKGTESLGDADGEIRNAITITLKEDGDLEFSEFTILNTKIADGMIFTELARYKDTKATPYTTYHYKPATFTRDAESGWGNEYPEEFDIRLRKVIENGNYDVVAYDFCGKKGAQTWGTKNDDGTITLKMLTGTYLSDRDYMGKGTESLGGIEEPMMGSITLTPDGDNWQVSDFATINVLLAGGAPTITILNKYIGGTATWVSGPRQEEEVPANVSIGGTYFFCSRDFTQSAESGWGNEYPARYEFTIEPALETEVNWDLRITNLCNQGKTYGGTLSDDGRTLTIDRPGYCYFSERDYKDKGTESLGDANGEIMNPITITLQPDGTLLFSEFTAICTKLGDGMTITELARYKNAKAAPYACYHYKPATFTRDAESGWGNEYPEEFDIRLRKVIENDNYDVVAYGFCGKQDAQTWGDANDDGTITLKMLTGTYLSGRDYMGKGTESLGGIEEPMMGSITLTPNEEGYAVSDFATINVLLAGGAPTITILNKYQGGQATLTSGFDFKTDVDTLPADESAAPIQTIEYYSVSGQRLGAPAKGLNLIRAVRADGTFTTRKMMVK